MGHRPASSISNNVVPGVVQRATISRRMLPIAAALLLALVLVAPVAADSSVNVFGCYLNGGVQVVEPGEVSVNSGWGAKSRGLVEAFLLAAIWNLTVDDAQVDVTEFLGPVTEREDGNWVVIWELPVGTLHASGDQVAVRVQLDFKHTVFNGEDTFRPGDVQEFDCTIVAE